MAAIGTIMQGIAAKNDAEFEAGQLEMKAQEEIAASQRDALDKRREGALASSRAQAVAAASGGGAGTDAPTIVKIMSGIAGQADYNAKTSLYGGRSRAQGLRQQAKATRDSAQASLLGSVIGGIGQTAETAAKMAFG